MATWTLESNTWDDIELKNFTYVADHRTIRRRCASIGVELDSAKGTYDTVGDRLDTLDIFVGVGDFSGPVVGAFIISASKPTEFHAEVTWSAGTAFNKVDYPALYQVYADSQTDYLPQVSSTTADLHGAVFNDGRLLMVGTNKGIYSTDGGITNVGSSSNPSGGMKAVAANGLTGANAVAVSVGDASKVYRTTGASAGDVWSVVTSIVAGDYNYRTIKYLNGEFVALAHKDLGGGTFETKVVSSTTGTAPWVVEQTLTGRWEDVEYDGSTYYLFVGHGGSGHAYSGLRSTNIDGTGVANVTFDGGASVPLLNSCSYESSGDLFTVCGNAGITGYKTPSTADIIKFTVVSGAVNLNFTEIDVYYSEVIAGGGLDSGSAYLYVIAFADVAEDALWIPDNVGAFELYDYAEDGAGAKVVVGAGGAIYRYAGVSDATFTVPYPTTTQLVDPHKPWVLTKSLGGTAGVLGEVLTPADITKLDTWLYIKVYETLTKLVRGLVVRDTDGLIIAYGDLGLLSISTDNGGSWTEKTTLGITDNIDNVMFNSLGNIIINTASSFYYSDNDLATIAQSTILGAEVPGSFVQVNTDDRLQAFRYSSSTPRGYNWASPYTGSFSVFTAWSSYSGYQPIDNSRVLFTDSQWRMILQDSTDFRILYGDSVAGNFVPDGSNSVVTTSTQTPINIQVSTAFGEIMIVCKDKIAYLTNEDTTATPSLRTFPAAMPVTDINDAAWGSGAWVLVTRKGCAYSTDSENWIWLQGALSATWVEYLQGKQRFIANALDEPGYIRLAIL